MPGLRDIDYDAITYYANPIEKSARRWEDVPKSEIRNTYDKLGMAKEGQLLPPLATHSRVSGNGVPQRP